jgi:asparagine synthase (glutamine-hydrolysing)
MCGVAGFTFREQREVLDRQAVLQEMLEAISHRGPDQRGTHFGDHVALGHNRLTIMEPQGGRQPRVNERTGSALIYNGEIYNHHRYDAEIGAAGGRLRDGCDTESLFWLIEIYGVSRALSIVDGMFALAYFDAASGALFLARDAFGQKPLFYAEVNGELIFASEIKSLRRHPGLAQVTPDFGALSLYLMMEYVPGPLTGVNEIRELPPGHILTYQKGRIDIQPFWRVSDVDRDPVTDESSAAVELDRRLNQAVEQQLVADVPVGVFLSGGLDSSLIAAIARRHKADVSTFTVKFPQASFDESRHAEEVASRIGTKHTTIELSPQACTDAVAKLLDHSDQPFSDSSMLPTYLLCNAARQYVTVAIGGDGADELFLGYPNFKLLRFAGIMAALPEAAGGGLRALGRILSRGNGYMSSGFLLRQLSYGIGRPAVLQSTCWMAAITPAEQQVFWQADQRDGHSIFEELSDRISAMGGATLVEQWQRHFLCSYLPYDILQKTDRASMYSGLEVRNPFLSNTVANYALTLPHSALFKGFSGKRILKRVAESYLPASTIARKKHGFALPVSDLIRNDLRGEVSAMLTDNSNSMYQFLHFGEIQKYLQLHNSEKIDLGKKIWALFMLAAFCKKQF